MQRYYKLLTIVAILLATFGWMMLDGTQITAPANNKQSKLNGAIVPDVRFKRLDDGEVILHSLKDHPVMLHFWASWCAPCRTEFPALLQRIKADPAKPILVAISGDADPKNAAAFMAPYLQQFPELFRSDRVIVGLDPSRTIIEGTFQTFQYPETILIDPDLRMQQKIIGPMDRPD